MSEEEMFAMLYTLRDSSQITVDEAPAVLMEICGLSETEANKVATAWIETGL